MNKIFISYRRQDSRAIAGRIYDRLETKFGRDAVFMDIDSIPPGVDFHAWLNGRVAEAAVMVALIGPSWADIPDEFGRRRLDNPDDFVRIEIEAALARNIPLIPLCATQYKACRCSSNASHAGEAFRSCVAPLRHAVN